MINYEFEYAAETTATPAAVWRLWSLVDRWPEWDAGVEHVDLAGPFEVGTEGTMLVPGQPLIEFRLTEVDQGRGFTDETTLPDAVVRFEHAISPAGEGRHQVVHRVLITARQDLADQLGPMITSDLPESVDALVALAEVESVDGA